MYVFNLLYSTLILHEMWEKNHYANVCRSPPSPSQQSQPVSQAGNTKSISQLTQDPTTADTSADHVTMTLDNDEYAKFMRYKNPAKYDLMAVCSKRSSDSPKAVVVVNGTWIEFLVDTSSAVNFIDEAMFNSLELSLKNKNSKFIPNSRNIFDKINVFFER